MRSINDIEAAVRKLTDNAGNKIDESIIPLIVGLHAHNIPTHFSCGGHEEKQDSYSYVHIYADDSEIDFEDYSDEMIAKKLIWIKKNQTILDRLTPLLGEFYSNRTTPYSEMITPQTSLGLKRIELKCTNPQSLEAMQKEMHDFSNFLIKKYHEIS